MKLREILLATAIPSAAALHQRVVAHSTTTTTIELGTPGQDISNYTRTISNAPPPVNTVVQDKPAVGASIMGLIVFSAAGLVLL